MNDLEQTKTQIQPPSSNDGCSKFFLIGCGTLIFLVILGGIISFVMFNKVVSSIEKDYVSQTPVKFKPLKIDKTEKVVLHERVSEFRENLLKNEPQREISLTSKEINILIQTAPELKELKDKFRVSFKDNKMAVDFSVNTDEKNKDASSQKFVNGKAIFGVEINNGVLFFAPHDIKINNNDIPGFIMDNIRGENIAPHFEDDLNELNKYIKKIGSLKIDGDSITIMPIPK